uniref:hypothetical protein n=1 Tax=Klebsiella pneumoniae TaxID=573 RepID=UPI00155DA582|nr:hypothetical protein [Klebsiella pneumoniae]
MSEIKFTQEQVLPFCDQLHLVFFTPPVESLIIQSRGHTIKNSAVEVNHRDRVAATGTGVDYRIVSNFAEAVSLMTQNEL